MTNATKRKLVVVGPSEERHTTLFEIKWEGGGELPDKLKGQYTSASEAKIAIASYLSTMKPEDEVALLKKDDDKRQVATVK